MEKYIAIIRYMAEHAREPGTGKYQVQERALSAEDLELQPLQELPDDLHNWAHEYMQGELELSQCKYLLEPDTLGATGYMLHVRDRTTSRQMAEVRLLTMEVYMSSLYKEFLGIVTNTLAQKQTKKLDMVTHDIDKYAPQGEASKWNDNILPLDVQAVRDVVQALREAEDAGSIQLAQIIKFPRRSQRNQRNSKQQKHRRN